MSPLVRWISFLVLFVLVLVIFILGLTFYDRNSQMVVVDYFLGSKEYYFSFHEYRDRPGLADNLPACPQTEKT